MKFSSEQIDGISAKLNKTLQINTRKQQRRATRRHAADGPARARAESPQAGRELLGAGHGQRLVFGFHHQAQLGLGARGADQDPATARKLGLDRLARGRQAGMGLQS